MSWRRPVAERPLDRLAENEIYRQMVRDNPKRDDENQIQYIARIAELVAVKLRGGRAEEVQDRG